jgi:glycosyltransferase involved in cell wall biosynthesis
LLINHIPSTFNKEKPLTDKIKVLCFDHEGGHGGSSRSLFSLLNDMPCDKMEIEVWCKKKSHLSDLYIQKGIRVEIHPELPTYAVFSPSNIDNLSLLKSKMQEFLRFSRKAKEMAKEISGRFDHLHFNHISFTLLAWYLRKTTALPATMHVRTIPYYSIMAKWQAQLVRKATDHFICITENEKTYMERFLGPGNASVVHNVAFPSITAPTKHTVIPDDNRMKIISLSNFHYIRGVDRIVDVASEINARQRENSVLFVLAGTMDLIKSLPGRLGEIGRKGGTLEDYVRERGLSHMFVFPGHITEPERLLAAGHMTIKLTRESNPWGRDIIESMAAGLPVITLGTWQGFVRHGETGIMQEKFDAQIIADEILALANNPEELRRMGTNGKSHIASVCNPHHASRKIFDIWNKLQSGA